jgi:predicted nucleic acid-binding Zn ribbon protein
MKRDLARELFRSFKDPTGFYRRKSGQRVEIEDRRSTTDPLLIKSTLNELVKRRDWEGALAEGNLFSSWSEIVGEEIAEHSDPVTFFEGVLTVRASSTAWATQLNLLKPSILEKIRMNVSDVLVDDLLVVGPKSPSWKKGLRTIKGARGPRDTYG